RLVQRQRVSRLGPFGDVAWRVGCKNSYNAAGGRGRSDFDHWNVAYARRRLQELGGGKAVDVGAIKASLYLQEFADGVAGDRTYDLSVRQLSDHVFSRRAADLWCATHAQAADQRFDFEERPGRGNRCRIGDDCVAGSGFSQRRDVPVHGYGPRQANEI